MSRGYGWVVLGGAVVWLALVVLVLIAFGSAAWGLLLGIGEVKTPTPDGEQRAGTAMAIGAATGLGALAMLVFSVALDIVTTVLSLRRLDGRRGDRAVPIIALLAVTGALVLPVVLAALALVASLIDLTQVTAALIWVLVLVVMALAPVVRLAQGIAGLVRLGTGELARPRDALQP